MSNYTRKLIGGEKAELEFPRSELSSSCLADASVAVSTWVNIAVVRWVMTAGRTRGPVYRGRLLIVSAGLMRFSPQ